MIQQVRIGYGPLNDTIAEQLAAQGLHSDAAEKFEKQRWAINLLYINGLLPDSQARKATERLHKRVLANLKELAPPEGKQ